ncbi:transmembrane protein, putative, partial [Bodo saltans]
KTKLSTSTVGVLPLQISFLSLIPSPPLYNIPLHKKKRETRPQSTHKNTPSLTLATCVVLSMQHDNQYTILVLIVNERAECS